MTEHTAILTIVETPPYGYKAECTCRRQSVVGDAEAVLIASIMHQQGEKRRAEMHR